MAITKKYLNEMFGTVLVLSALLSTVTAVDCNGKSFHCVNSTHFMICVDLGGGISQAIDNFLVACPPPTVCQGTNHFECEYPAPVTPSTTLSNFFSETTQPWEEVVTVSSSGNSTKEFSENYMNTERITTTADYSVTTDTTVDLTTATASEWNVNNTLNIPDIVPTLGAEIATSAIEMTTTLNENLNIIQYVPTEGAVDITTAVIETLTQSTDESKNLTETGPIIVDEITATAAGTITENIIMTDTIAAETGYTAPSATEQVPQTIHENLNITETEITGVTKDITTTIIETVTQYTTESRNSTENEHVVVDEITATTTESTTDTIIITDSFGTNLEYTEPTTTDNLLELETAQSKTEQPQVTILLQNDIVSLLKDPSIGHKNPLNIEKPISSTDNNINESNLDKALISETKNASKTDSVVQNILPIQTTATVDTVVQTATGSIEHLTTIPVDSITDDFTTAPPLDSKIKESESVNVLETSKRLSSFDGIDRPNASIKGNKQSTAKEIENKEPEMPTSIDPVTLYNSTAAKNHTEKQANTTGERVIVSNINTTTLPDNNIVITDVPHVYDHDGKENNVYTTTNISIRENKYTADTNVPTENKLIITTNTPNPAETTVLDGTWTETIDNGASTEQPTTVNQGSITTDSTQNFVSEYTIVPKSQTVNLDVTTTDVVPTTGSDVQSVLPDFEGYMNNEPQVPITENTVSTVNNGASTNGFMTVESVHMNTITTDVVDLPTTIIDAHMTTPAFENNMKILIFTPPVTEKNIPTVTNQLSSNGFTVTQAVNIDTITTEAIGIPSANSNTQSIQATFEDNIAATENILSTANKKADTNDFMSAQASNFDTIATDAIYKLTTVTNDQANTFVDIIKTEAPLPATENIVFPVNNGDDLMTARPVKIDIINTAGIISNVQPMRPTFEDNITKDTPLAATDNIASSVNYGVSTNDLTTSKSVNVDVVIKETTHKPTTISNAPPKSLTIEDNIMTDVPPSTENILSSVNNGASANGFVTTPAVNIDIINNVTINNASTIAPDFDNSTITEISLSTTNNIVTAIKNGVSKNVLTTTRPIILEQITRKAGLETDVQLTTETYTVPSSKVIELSLNNKKDIITAETGTTAPDIIKVSPNTAIQNTEKIISSSVNTAMESNVNTFFEDNYMTTMATNNIFETADIRKEYSPDFPSSKNTPAAGLDVNQSTSHVLPIENVNEQTPVYTDATSQKEAQFVTDNIIKASTTQSIPALGFDPAFDTSNQNVINPQVESAKSLSTSQVTINLQPDTVEHNDQVDNIIWNPLANQVFNNPNQNSESIGTINVERNDRDGEKHNTENILQQATSSVITVSPIYALIDHGQSIESIPTQSSIGITDAKDILATKGHLEKIAKVNSEHETDYRSSTQSEIPVTISFNQKTDKLETVEVDVLSVSTTLPAMISVADTTIPDSLKAKHGPTDDSFSPSTGSIVETNNTPRKSGSNAEAFLDQKEYNINAKVNQDPSINSFSVTNGNISEVKSSVVIGGNIDSPTVLQTNEPKLPTTSQGFSEATSVRTPIEVNKINEEDETLRKSVMLDVLPLPINNIQFNAPTKHIPALTDFISNTQAKNTVIITESYKPATTRPSLIVTKIQDSVKVGDFPTLSRIEEPAFNYQTGVTDRTSGTITVPKVGSSTSNPKTSILVNTVARNGDATFNSQTKSIDEAIGLAQTSYVEETPNIKTSAPKDAYVIPDLELSGSGTNAGNPHNIHSPTTSNNQNTEIVTPESVSNCESHKSVNLLQEPVSSKVYQKSNPTNVTDLKPASQNISFNTEKASHTQQSIESDNRQSEVAQQNNSTNITSSISTKDQKISTSTVQTPSQMATPNPISNNNLNKQVSTDAAQTFACINGVRGRYSDKDDCRKFYICIGNNVPIVGYCPENTVFSDLKKLCTKNMSHCIRENQFKCPSAGRFSDFIKDNVYYICVNHNTKLYRFKFQCQKGYILDKTKVHCIETKEIESNESVSISSSDNSSQTSSIAISSNTSSKSTSTSSKSNSSSRPASGNIKNDNSLKSKISNEAVETSEKSEGNDDDDDEEVFQCKKEGKFPIHNECRRYYLCKKNRKSEYRRKIKKCNSGKVFHKDRKKCVDDDSYEC